MWSARSESPLFLSCQLLLLLLMMIKREKKPSRKIKLGLDLTADPIVKCSHALVKLQVHYSPMFPSLTHFSCLSAAVHNCST
jgi:hypothetical protein